MCLTHYARYHASSSRLFPSPYSKETSIKKFNRWFKRLFQAWLRKQQYNIVFVREYHPFGNSYFQFPYHFLVLITLAGTPATIEYSGTSCVTTAPAAIILPSPICTPGRIITRSPIQTSLPIITGCSFSIP